MLAFAVTFLVLFLVITTMFILMGYPAREDEPIEIHTVWHVRADVYVRDGSRYALMLWDEEFTAPNRPDAVRHFFEHARASGWWVRRIRSCRPAGVLAVAVKKPAA